MNCPNCGKVIPDNAKFCKRCGVQIDSARKQQNGGKGSGESRKWLVILIAVLVLALAGAGVAAFVLLGGNNEGTEEVSSQVVDDSGSDEEEVDVSEYYLSHSNILEAIDAETSPDVMTEAEVTAAFAERGFGDCEITSCYELDGTYYFDEAISNDGTGEHPTYDAYYTTPDGFIWYISAYNGFFMANPLSYNLTLDGTSTAVILSEQNYIMSYDSDTGKFYRMVPDESELLIKSVGSINAETLNSLTAEEVAKL